MCRAKSINQFVCACVSSRGIWQALECWLEEGLQGGPVAQEKGGVAAVGHTTSQGRKAQFRTLAVLHGELWLGRLGAVWLPDSSPTRLSACDF
jgi:hypothetical protein